MNFAVSCGEGEGEGGMEKKKKEVTGCCVQHVTSPNPVIGGRVGSLDIGSAYQHPQPCKVRCGVLVVSMVKKKIGNLL